MRFIRGKQPGVDSLITLPVMSPCSVRRGFLFDHFSHVFLCWAFFRLLIKAPTDRQLCDNTALWRSNERNSWLDSGPAEGKEGFSAALHAVFKHQVMEDKQSMQIAFSSSRALCRVIIWSGSEVLQWKPQKWLTTVKHGVLVLKQFALCFDGQFICPPA